MNMNPVVHFEMPYEDRDRMADFYAKAFGWKSEMYGPEMGNYVVAHTTETTAEGMIQEPGRINGGFYQKPEDPAGQVPSVVIAVDDIQSAMERVRASSGTILGEPMDIPGVGKYVSFLDTEGNRASMLQAIARR
ncbi:MAG: VOC family protein [Candidatus Moraniibacteriota bacterium]